MAALGAWGLMPPEVIAGQVMTGDNGASLAAAVAAYEALVAALTTEGATMATNTASTAAGGWEGLGGTAMMATATPYVAALETLSGWIQQAGAAAASILDAYTTTRTSLIPVSTVEVNQTHLKEACMNNPFGVRLPEILFLVGQYEEYWTQNASLAGSYEAFAMGVLATLATPPPPSPLTANPAGPAAQAAAIGEAAANGAVNAGMHTSLQGVNEAASGAQAGAAPAEAAQSMLSSAPQMLSQFPQMAGQLPQMLGQFPQMLSQFPQMAMGMLGPLTSGMNANTAGLDTLSKTGADLAPVATSGGMAGGGAASSGPGSAGSAVMSSFTRPTSSFNAPGPPKLPTGWSTTQAAAAGPEVATSAQPAMTGGTGGLYGAPGMTGNERGAETTRQVRTMRLTTAPAPERGE